MTQLYQMNADILPMIHFIDDTIIRPPYVHKRRRSGEYIMYLIKHGEMYLTENERALTLKEGDICLLDPFLTHAGVKASTCDYYYIHFMHHALQLLPEQEEANILELLLQMRFSSLKSDVLSYEKCEGNSLYLPKLWHVDDISLWMKIEKLLQAAKQENNNPMENYKLMCACQIQQVFIEISRGYFTSKSEAYTRKLPAYYHKVQALLEWLNSNFQTPVSGERLEQEFDGNFDYMNRVFKQVTGQTIFQYLTQVRIQHAKALLRHTPMKISEAGRRSGFPDEYYFSRIFKKHTGMSPASYAKSISSGEPKN